MIKWTLASLAALTLMGASTFAQAQDAPAPATSETKADAPSGRREGRPGGGQLTTATLERSITRRLAAWEAAKIPADKIAKAKELVPKMKAALEAGNQDEVRTLQRSMMEILTPEERTAVNAQARANRRGPGGYGATTGTVERRRGPGGPGAPEAPAPPPAIN